jgi:hypothetical protein
MPLTKVSSGVIAANAVVDSFGTQSITGDKLGLTAINANNIVNATITGAKIATGQITGNLLTANCVSGNNIVASVTLTTPIISGNLNLDSAGTTGVRVPSANTIAFHTAGTEDMRIDPSGNVGIGTSSPGAKLHIVSADGGSTTGLTVQKSGQNFFQFYADTNNTDGVVTCAGAIRFENGSNTERMRIDSSGNLLFNSGYGSVAVAYGCRAWVNFNGTGTVAIRGSGNVSSITDNGTGRYTVNFTTALVDVNYGASVSVSSQPAVSDANLFTTDIASNNARLNPTTSAFAISTWNAQFGSLDIEFVRIAIFR